MAKFKVGDKVRVLNSPYLTYRPGAVVEVLATGVTGRRGGIRVQSGMDIDLTFYADELEKVGPKAPKPKTIPARNLSGKHIGRVVTVTLKSGAEVKAELSMVGHGADDGGVTVVLKGVAPEEVWGHRDGFEIDPDSQVTLS